MAKTFLPLAKSPITTPDLWVKAARNWLATGVIKAYLNELQVYANSTGMNVKVKSGAANMQGIYFDSDAEEVLSIAAANASNPRIDRIIVRLDLLADSTDFAVLQGVPAVSPVAPAVTQNSSRWEISLAQVYVGANVSTIAAGNITDERNFVSNSMLEDNIDLVLQNGISGNARIYRNNFGMIFLEFNINAPDGLAASSLVATIPVGYRPVRQYTLILPGWKASSSSYVTTEMTVNIDGTIKLATGTTGAYGQYLFAKSFWRTDK